METSISAALCCRSWNENQKFITSTDFHSFYFVYYKPQQYFRLDHIYYWLDANNLVIFLVLSSQEFDIKQNANEDEKCNKIEGNTTL